MLLRFSLLILLDIIFAMALSQEQLILAAIVTIGFLLYTIELAVEMDFNDTELVMIQY